MNRTATAILVAIIAIAGLGGLVALTNNSDNPEPAITQTTDNNAPPSTTTTQPNQSLETSEVEIDNSTFKQNDITVKKGTTVTWTNNDSIEHDVSPDEDSDNFKPSELLKKGESYSFTFNVAGTYTYHCTPHPFMTGKVVVTE